MAKNLDKFESHQFYHVYNRANGIEKLFYRDANYHYFIKLLRKYIYDFAEFHAFCLIPNHFHLLVRCKEIKNHDVLSNQFKKLFTVYSKAINAQESRMGSLFMRPYKRKQVDTDAYYSELLRYIHHNPAKHGVLDDFASYPWSSYDALISKSSSFLNKQYVLDWFGGIDSFVDFHSKEPKGVSFEIALED